MPRVSPMARSTANSIDPSHGRKVTGFGTPSDMSTGNMITRSLTARLLTAPPATPSDPARGTRAPSPDDLLVIACRRRSGGPHTPRSILADPVDQRNPPGLSRTRYNPNPTPVHQARREPGGRAL